MMDLVFFVKTLILTLLVVLILQIKIGTNTIENHAAGMYQGIGLSKPLGEVAQGGAKLVREFVETLHEKVNSKFGSKDSRNGKSSDSRD